MISEGNHIWSPFIFWKRKPTYINKVYLEKKVHSYPETQYLFNILDFFSAWQIDNEFFYIFIYNDLKYFFISGRYLQGQQ